MDSLDFINNEHPEIQIHIKVSCWSVQYFMKNQVNHLGIHFGTDS